MYPRLGMRPRHPYPGHRRRIKERKDWKRRIKKYLPFHSLIDLVLQWVPQLDHSGLDVLFFWLGAVSRFPSTFECKLLVRDCA
jgi:hypothetical protein